MPETPEQRARRAIDADLTAAGWLVQSRDELDLTAGRGIAVREFPMKSGFGFADYLLYLDRRAVGAIELEPRWYRAFGVHRNTVRTALAALEQAGLIRVQPQPGRPALVEVIGGDVHVSKGGYVERDEHRP